MSEEEVQKILDELHQVNPKHLNNDAKRLYEAIMKIADERDMYEERNENAIEYIENHKLDFKQGTTTFGSERLSMEERKLLDILRGEDNE